MTEKRRRRRKVEHIRGEGAPAPGRPGRLSDEALHDRIIDAAMALFGERGWRHVTLPDIAAASGLTLAQLYTAFPTKIAVLDAFERRINEKTLDGDLDPNDSVRDRLFDIVMRRLDALAPYKEAVRALAEELPREPTAALRVGPRLLLAMQWMAEAAGVETGGLRGWLRVNGLTAIYLAALRAWLDDDSADDARTMATLDRALKRAETIIRSMPGGRRAPPEAA
jgi:AcrR family transcriptional regulator